MQLIRDISDSSAFWGAAWVLSCFPDVHTVCDMPIGCFAMLGIGVTDYTDALPYLPNFTPAVIHEEDVMIKGTEQSVTRTIEYLRDTGELEGKHLIVLSSAESELIGADHTNLLKSLDPKGRFIWGQSLEHDEWVGRDRTLLFIWREYGKPYVPSPPPTPAPNRVNIIGPTLGCFNSPSDLHEVKRLITGVGGEINLVYPYEATIAETPRLVDAAVNVVMYHEFGEPLAKELGKPYLFAPFGIQGTTRFLRELGQHIGTPPEQVEQFIEQEKRTTLLPVWDMWRGPQSDWFSTVNCCIVGGRSYTDGLYDFFFNELGIEVVWMSGQPRRENEPDNITIRKLLHERVPTMVFATINEKVFMDEVNSSSHFIPTGFPMPIVRRALGTPFMGYSGTVYLVQDIVNRLYEMVVNFLPVEIVKRDGTPAGVPEEAYEERTMLWTDDAAERLNKAVEQLPFLGRVSAIRTLRKAAEHLARLQGTTEVTLAIVEESLARRE